MTAQYPDKQFHRILSVPDDYEACATHEGDKTENPSVNLMHLRRITVFATETGIEGKEDYNRCARFRVGNLRFRPHMLLA